MRAHRVRYLTSGTATTRRVEGVVQDRVDDRVWHVLESAAPNPHLRTADITVTVVGGTQLVVEGHRPDETPQYLAGIRARVGNAIDAIERVSELELEAVGRWMEEAGTTDPSYGELADVDHAAWLDPADADEYRRLTDTL